MDPDTIHSRDRTHRYGSFYIEEDLTQALSYAAGRNFLEKYETRALLQVLWTFPLHAGEGVQSHLI